MPTNQVPNLPTSWVDGSARPTNLYTAINDIAYALNTAFPLGLTVQTYTPQLVVNDGTEASAPTTGTNPTLGTGSSQTGLYWRIGKLVVASFRIKFGTASVSAGSGAYRITLPVVCTTTANSNNHVLGTGQIHNADGGYLGLGPGAYRTVQYHTATSVANSVAGLVLGDQHPGLSSSLPPFSGYTVTNELADRTYDADTVAVAELADVVGTMVNDLIEQFANNISDNCSNAIPWTWAASDEVIGILCYFTP